MKIAVCSIALNEENHVQRWVESAKEADQLVVTDTGSIDNTRARLHDHGVETHSIRIKPFRFDDARNASLNFVRPDMDIVVHLDMDEVFVPGWREIIERHWTEGITRMSYQFVWSWLAPGHPSRMYYGDKITGRFTHRWRHPVHEVLSPTVPERLATYRGILIEHHADADKQRSSYLDLLELSIREDPMDDRNAHYYARELYFRERYEDAIREFQRHLSLPTARWAPERCASLRYVGYCHDAMNRQQSAYNAYVMATLEDPQSREAYLDLAKMLLRHDEWSGVVHYCMKAANVPPEVQTYITERYAREEGPYDLASVAMHNMGQKQAALEFAKKALTFNPDDPRLQENVRVMESPDAISKIR